MPPIEEEGRVGSEVAPTEARHDEGDVEDESVVSDWTDVFREASGEDGEGEVSSPEASSQDEGGQDAKAEPQEGAQEEGTKEEVPVKETPPPEGPKPEEGKRVEGQAQPAPSAVPALSFDEWRMQAEEQMASKYSLGEGELEGLNSEPEKAIPKMLARVYLDAVVASGQMMANYLPQMLKGLETNRAVEEAFFTKWPALRSRSDLAGEIESVARMYTQLNPTKSLEERINAVGSYIHLTKQIPIPDASLPKGNGSRRPAGPPPISAPQVPKGQPANQWEALAEEIIEHEGIP